MAEMDGTRSVPTTLLYAAAEAAGFDLSDGPIDRLVVILQPRLPIVENSAERTLLVEIDRRHGKLDNLQRGSRRLDPDFQGHGIAGLADIQLSQRINAVAFEAAKGIGQIKAKAAVQFGRDVLIDAASLRRRRCIASELGQIAA